MSSQTFDPYYVWLSIPKSEQPANYYRLLGVPLFEPDFEVISSAADRQIAHVANFINGTHSREAHEVLRELSQARHCLLTSQIRLEYDILLRKRLSQRNTYTGQFHETSSSHGAHDQTGRRSLIISSTVSSRETQGSSASSTASDQQMPERQSILVVAPQVARSRYRSSRSRYARYGRTRKRKDRTFFWVMYVVSSLTGLLLGYIVLCSLSRQADVMNLFHDSIAKHNTDSRSKESNGETRGFQNEGGHKGSSKNTPLVLTHQAENNDTKEDAQPEDKADGESDKQIASKLVKPKKHLLEGVPSHLQLPDVEDTGAVKLVTFREDATTPKLFQSVDLNLVSHETDLSDNVHYYLERDREQEERPLWRVYHGPNPPRVTLPFKELEAAQCASLWLADGGLNFQWLETTKDASKDQLCNCVLAISAGTETRNLPLRTPVEIESFEVDLADRVAVISAEPLAPPLAENLVFEITELTGFPTDCEPEPEDKRVKIGDSLKLKFDRSAEAYFLLDTQMINDKITLTLRGRYKLAKRREYPFTEQQFQKQRAALGNTIAAKKAAYKRCEELANLLARRHKEVFDTPVGNAQESHQKDVLLVEIQTEIKVNQGRGQAIELALPALINDYDRLPAIQKLGTELHEKTSIHYRVFFKCGDQEVDLIRSVEK